MTEVCKAPKQFSAHNRDDPNYAKMMSVTEADPQFKIALKLANAAADGTLADDPTMAANHYCTIDISPMWATGRQPIATVGRHKFYRL